MVILGEKEWFLLFNLSRMGALNGISKSSTEIASLLSTSQQTISRRLKKLRDSGYIMKSLEEDILQIKISEKGKTALNSVFQDLKKILVEKGKQQYYGQVQTGLGEGKFYVQLPKYHEQFKDILNDSPYPGTLNISLAPEYLEDFYYTLSQKSHHKVSGFESEERSYGSVKCYDILLNTNGKSKNEVECLLVDIRRTSHQKGTIEIVSQFNLRDMLHLIDGSLVKIEFRT
ncbi:MAG: CTP-dependent riboflavin kinase [Candidatus Lokiarchaeota archaeon]|nr:CTP-dependent riboflavin kinase [Candidatus Lokiarchaeota archaeon]